MPYLHYVNRSVSRKGNLTCQNQVVLMLCFHCITICSIIMTSTTNYTLGKISENIGLYVYKTRSIHIQTLTSINFDLCESIRICRNENTADASSKVGYIKQKNNIQNNTNPTLHKKHIFCPYRSMLITFRILTNGHFIHENCCTVKSRLTNAFFKYNNENSESSKKY